MSAAQAGQQEEQQQKEPEATQMGSRWLHRMPTEEQVKSWFDTQHLHEGMQPGPYYGGIVVIAATEKYKITKQKNNGDTFVSEVERATFTPYVKVDTRIAYFWELVRKMNELAEEDKYVGVIEAVEQRVITNDRSPYYNEHLPEGFFVQAVKNRDDSITRFACCQQRVSIYERSSYAERIAGRPPLPVLRGVGTKQTTLAKVWADDNALMKAETGAIGRALGVAGILVVGTGVATAEDMQEAQAGPSGSQAASSVAQPSVPEVVGGGAPDTPGAPMEGPVVDAGQVQGPAVEEPESPQEADDKLRQRARELNTELKAASEDAHAAYLEWYQGRGFPALTELSGPALKGAVVKLERSLAEASGQ